MVELSALRLRASESIAIRNTLINIELGTVFFSTTSCPNMQASKRKGPIPKKGALMVQQLSILAKSTKPECRLRLNLDMYAALVLEKKQTLVKD